MGHGFTPPGGHQWWLFFAESTFSVPPVAAAAAPAADDNICFHPLCVMAGYELEVIIWYINEVPLEDKRSVIGDKMSDSYVFIYYLFSTILY